MLDWSIIDAQVAESMKDVDEDGDDDVTEDDENELMVGFPATRPTSAFYFLVYLNFSLNLYVKLTKILLWVTILHAMGLHYVLHRGGEPVACVNI